MAHLFKCRTKIMKRSLILFLSFVLVTAITVGSVYATSLANSTEAENGATPKYYSAVKDWDGTNNNSESVFNYQFAMDSENLNWDYMSAKSWGYWYTGDTDYTHFTDMTQEEWSSKFTNSSFELACGISPKTYMRIWNNGNCLSFIDTKPAVALAYIAKNDGYVNINSHSVSLFSRYYTKGNGYEILLRITKNGENLYPESGYSTISETVTSASFPELDFSVAEGDVIRFEMTSSSTISVSSGDNIGVIWNPSIYVRTEETLYTEETSVSDYEDTSSYLSEGIFGKLTSFMDAFFRGQTSETMETTDALTLAKENANKSKYGVYTAYDSIYSGGIIASDDSSVWKYGAVASIPSGFVVPTVDYSLNTAVVENGTQISWDSGYATAVNAIKVLYGGKSYTYMTTVDQSEIVLPIILGEEDSFVIQAGGNNGTSEILEVSASGSRLIADVNTANINGILYLNNCVKSGTGITSKYTLSNSDCESSYDFLYAMNSVTSETAAQNYRRTIIYNAVNEEQMMFGFTAVQSGDYEVTAPIEVKNDTNVKYSILKEDENGIFTVIDGPRNYTDEKTGFVSAVTLKAGETVWLNASADADTEIYIGIPTVTFKEVVSDSEGTAAYKYRAVDYVESSAFNGCSYNSASLTDKAGSVWEFGTFENPIETVDDAVNYDTLGYTTLDVGDDASDIISQFKPYEIIRGGIWYNSLAMVVNSEGVIGATHANGVAGTIHTLLGTSYSERDKKGLPYLSKGFMVAVGVQSGKDGVNHNIGVYMKFTAPSNGNVPLNLSDFVEARTATRVTVLKGDEVVKTYSSVIPKGEVIDFGYMEKGEKIFICYGVDTNSKPYNYAGFPVVTVSGEKSTFSFGSNLVLNATSINYSVINNTKFTLPSFADTIGKAVIGWNEEGGSYYSIGRTYTVKKDTVFNPVRRFYGDMTGDSKINATDLNVIKKNIIGGKNDLLVLSDVTTDGNLNLKDLVRMKKWLAGYAVPFYEE